MSTDGSFPATWHRRPLGEVVSINAGQVDPTLPEYRVLPHVNGERIESGTGQLVGIRTAEQDGMTSGKYLFEPGCVLYSKLRPYLRKVAVADFAGVCSADMYPLIPASGVVDPDFLCWLLLSEDFTAYADEESRRARMPKLNRDQLFAWVAPLPPLGEQRRIAGILKEQMEAVERARVAAEAQLEAAKALPAAFLRDVFNSNDAQAWPRKTIDQLRSEGALTYHQDGNHGELHPRVADFQDSGVKFVTAKLFERNGTLSLTDAPHISEEQAGGLRIGFGKPNDVLLAHNATVGPVVMAPSDCEDFIVGTSVTIFRGHPDVLAQQWLFWSLQSDDFQNQLIDAMKQTTRNQVPITRQRELSVAVPPVGQQLAISKELAGRVKSSHRAFIAVEDQLAAINALPAALLRQAFSGQL